MRSGLGIFLAALNIAILIVVVCWLHSPPPGYSGLSTGWWTKLLDDPNAMFAMFVAAFTAALVWIGFLQWKDSRLLQRAYLSVEPLGISCRKDGPWFATVGIHNAGRLPARDVRWYIQIEPFMEDEDWANHRQPIEARKGPVVPPGATVRRASRRFFVETRYPSERFLYVWGEVSYTDGFGGSRFTKFCHRYNSHAIVPAAGGFAFQRKMLAITITATKRPEPRNMLR
jgi:hypothetical protein